MEEYEYRTDETEIMEYTEGLRNVLNCNETYKIIFCCFKEKNMSALAENMVQMINAINNLKRRVSEKDNNIEYLKNQIAEKESKISSLLAELEKLRKHKDEKDIQIMKRIKTLYDEGCSLRKIGEELHMDKSTVKRKLIKLGYTFD